MKGKKRGRGPRMQMADDDDVVLFKIGVHLSCIPSGVKEGEERIYKRCELLL